MSKARKLIGEVLEGFPVEIVPSYSGDMVKLVVTDHRSEKTIEFDSRWFSQPSSQSPAKRWLRGLIKDAIGELLEDRSQEGVES